MIEKKDYLQFKKLNEYAEVIHCTTKKPFNFNNKTTSSNQLSKNYKKLEQELGFQFLAIKNPMQTHSNHVRIVTEENKEESFEDTDGLITNLKGIALTIKTADCQAILLYDPIKKVIGNIHSGWKGTLSKISREAIQMMQKHFDCNPKDIQAFICPSILKCCFEVDEDVVTLFKQAFQNIEEDIYPRITKNKIQKYVIDTVSINKKEMISLGLLPENIYCSNHCTKCESENFHSYRKEKDHSGRNLSLICLRIERCRMSS